VSTSFRVVIRWIAANLPAPRPTIALSIRADQAMVRFFRAVFF